jgi:hypothetical protein
MTFVIQQSILAPKGKLKGVVKMEPNDENEMEIQVESDTSLINVTFPDILEKDIQSRINAIISAATLDGKSLADTMELEFVARLLMEALGIDNVDEKLNEMFEDGVLKKSTKEIVDDSMEDLKVAIEEALREGNGAKK